MDRILLKVVCVFVFVICTTTASILPEACPQVDVPSILNFPRAGKAAIQIEVDNPKSSFHEFFQSFPSLLAWLLFDSDQGIRIDVPNPTQDFQSFNEALPILLSMFVRPATGDIFLVDPSGITNSTCYRSTFNATESGSTILSFFEKFTYRGMDNVNSFASYKWSRSIPVVGTFIYYETCDSRRIPLQIHYMPSAVITKIIEEKISEHSPLLSNITHTKTAKEYKMFLELMMKSQGQEMEKYYFATTTAGTSTGNNIQSRHSSPFDFVNEFLKPNISLPFSIPSWFSLTSSLDSSGSSGSSDPTNSFDYPGYSDSPYSTSSRCESSAESSSASEYSNYWNNLSSGSESQDELSNDESDNDQSDNPDSSANFIVDRVAFLNWVNGALDPLTLVPPLYCYDDSVSIVPIKSFYDMQN